MADAAEKLSASAVLKTLQQTEQDFEWYPTTDDIIQVIRKDLISFYGTPSSTGQTVSASVLDCGAGDGRVLQKITDNCNRYAIEKSRPLLDNLDPGIFVVGTEFFAQSLLDKKVDVVFCNPPYSDYQQWASKIITEANSDLVYLVIPSRWRASQAIEHALSIRKAKHTSIGEFDFLSADRKARCHVEILRITLRPWSS